MPDTPELPPVDPALADRMFIDRDPDSPREWPKEWKPLGQTTERPPAAFDPHQLDTAELDRLLQPLTAADAHRLRHSEPVNLALYTGTPDLGQLREADQIPLPVEVDVYEMLRAGMGLFYSIYYLSGQDADEFLAAMPEQVVQAFMRAGQAFAPNDYRPQPSRRGGDTDDA